MHVIEYRVIIYTRTVHISSKNDVVLVVSESWLELFDETK